MLCFICCHAEWHNAECHYAECHCTECHYAESRGAVGNIQAEHVKHKQGLNLAETLFA